MRCPEFLALYSDYRDGLITDLGLLRGVRQHLRHCATCRRYDAAIERGVALLRGAQFDSGYSVSLASTEVRSRHAVDEPLTPAPAGFIGGLMLAAAITLLIWEGVSDAPESEAAVAPMPTSAAPIAVANAGLPFVRFAADATASPDDSEPPPPPPPTDAASLNPTLTLYQPTPDR